MILRRVTKHVKDQNWFAVGLDFIIVVFGVFIGLQVSNWNDARQERNNEAEYIQRLDAEMDVIRARLVAGEQTYSQSLRSIELLMDVRRQYDSDVTAEIPSEAELSIAASGAGSGMVPAGSPAALKEMMSSGALVTLSNDELRQALFAYDEFAAINLNAWQTLRMSQSDALNRILSFGDLSMPNDLNDLSSALGDGATLRGFDVQDFLDDPDIPGYLRVLLGAQANQLGLVQQQLALAESIEELIDKGSN
ncbi:MAG: hypothetical protein AAFO74_12735 [Pseudomonadota bacterium]